MTLLEAGKKPTAVALMAALIVLSPGIEPYRVWAADLTAPETVPLDVNSGGFPAIGIGVAAQGFAAGAAVNAGGVSAAIQKTVLPKTPAGDSPSAGSIDSEASATSQPTSQAADLPSEATLTSIGQTAPEPTPTAVQPLRELQKNVARGASLEEIGSELNAMFGEGGSLPEPGTAVDASAKPGAATRLSITRPVVSASAPEGKDVPFKKPPLAIPLPGGAALGGRISPGAIRAPAPVSRWRLNERGSLSIGEGKMTMRGLSMLLVALPIGAVTLGLHAAAAASAGPVLALYAAAAIAGGILAVSGLLSPEGKHGWGTQLAFLLPALPLADFGFAALAGSLLHGTGLAAVAGLVGAIGAGATTLGAAGLAFYLTMVSPYGLVSLTTPAAQAAAPRNDQPKDARTAIDGPRSESRPSKLANALALLPLVALMAGQCLLPIVSFLAPLPAAFVLMTRPAWGLALAAMAGAVATCVGDFMTETGNNTTNANFYSMFAGFALQAVGMGGLARALLAAAPVAAHVAGCVFAGVAVMNGLILAYSIVVNVLAWRAGKASKVAPRRKESQKPAVADDLPAWTAYARGGAIMGAAASAVMLVWSGLLKVFGDPSSVTSLLPVTAHLGAALLAGAAVAGALGWVRGKLAGSALFSGGTALPIVRIAAALAAAFLIVPALLSPAVGAYFLPGAALLCIPAAILALGSTIKIGSEGGYEHEDGAAPLAIFFCSLFIIGPSILAVAGIGAAVLHAGALAAGLLGGHNLPLPAGAIAIWNALPAPVWALIGAVLLAITAYHYLWPRYQLRKYGYTGSILAEHGKLALVLARDKSSAFLWDTDKRLEVASLPMDKDLDTLSLQTQISADASKVVFNTYDRVILWQTATGASWRFDHEGGSSTSDAALSGDGRLLVIHDQSFKLRFVSADSGKVLAESELVPTARDNTPPAFVFSPDGKRLAILQYNALADVYGVTFWDLATFRLGKTVIRDRFIETVRFKDKDTAVIIYRNMGRGTGTGGTETVGLPPLGSRTAK